MLEPITSYQELAQAVDKVGFLPLFRNEIEGFSVEERTPPEFWFADDRDGPWEWKGPVIRSTGCAYGKLFRGKAGFVSAAWYPDFANYRRDGYDFDALYDDGLARCQDKTVYDIIEQSGSLLSKDLKRLGGFCKQGRKGFDAIMTRLQMQCYVTTTDFVYQQDKQGKPYGWGVARYATPECHFGRAFSDAVYRNSPMESMEKIAGHLSKLLPDAAVHKHKILKLLE